MALELTPISHLFDIRHNFNQPSDVAVAKDGRIYVVDGANQAVKSFDNKGNFLFSFGQAGSSPGRFAAPLGIDIDDSGKVYVADSGNHRIQIFSPDGQFVREISMLHDSQKPADPTDVVVNGPGTQLFVADNENHYVLKYDLTNDKLLGKFGKPGLERLEFRYPFLLSCYQDRYLYVVDVINTRVQEITAEGKFVRFIGDWGVEKGHFFRPKGVAIDSSGKVFVSDSYLGVIQVFIEGVFHSVVGNSRQGKLWRFKTPTGIFIDTNNYLYVVEMALDRVSVYTVGN